MIVDHRLIQKIVQDIEIDIHLSFPLLLVASTGLLLYFVCFRRDSE